MSELHDHHRRMLEVESAIAPDVIAERAPFTATQRKQLRDANFSDGQAKLVPALVLPVFDAFGRVALHQARPDDPRRDRNGKPIKYETPTGARMAIDVPPRVRPALGDPSKPLLLTEGIRKDDAAASAGLNAIGLLGVWNWRGRNEHGGLTALADWHEIALNERRVLLAFDSDAMAKREVHDALEALIAFLRRRDAEPWVIYLPSLNGGAKCGLDDYLAAGHSADELLKLARPELLPLPGETRSAAQPKPKRPALPTATLLASVEQFARSYVHFTNDQSARALTLYVLHTWAFDATDVTPYVHLESPEMQSGKTRALEVLALLCPNPVLAGSITAAGVYQAISEWHPVLLLDEADALFASGDDLAQALRGILDAGNRRGAFAVRGGKDGKPLKFDAYCPKVLAGIATRKLPQTVRDRAIVIPMQRKLRSEVVKRLRHRRVRGEAEELRDRLHDWAAAHADELAAYEAPDEIEEINDRLDEAWEPLFAIAQLGGGDWPTWARDAAQALAGADVSEPSGTAHRVLFALRDLFDGDAMWTSDVLDALNGDPDLGFADWNDGEGIRATELAHHLGYYRIRPRTVRVGERTRRGYRREQFEDAWNRWGERDSDRPEDDADDAQHELPLSPEHSQAQQPTQPAPRAGLRPIGKAQHEADVAGSGSGANPHQDWDVSAVAANHAQDTKSDDDDLLFDRIDESDFDARVDRLERMQEGD